MPDSSDSRNPVELLAEEFMERKRRGEKPSLSEYTDRFPDLAADIRDLFPALVIMEDLGDSSLAATGPQLASSDAAPERIGDYRILREVGRGGMGVVYEAEQESLGRRVALKVLPPHVLNDSQQVRRFEREARAAARLHHTNIVPVFGVGSDQGMHYYVMQFIQGLGLDEVLEELKQLRQTSGGVYPRRSIHRDKPGGSPASEIAHSLATGTFAATAPQPLPSAPLSDSSITRLPGGSALSTVSESDARYGRSVARIGVQVAEALDYAHSQGILHRDIKPSNLLLDMHGTVWVTDFGLAKGGDADNLTHTGDIVGTIRYMAPERFSGKSDARSDVYALGLTLYELLTLKPAFTEHDRAKLMQQVLHGDPPPLRRVDRSVPRDLETIIHKAMAREPERRYPTARAFAEDLQRFIEDRPIRARRVSTRERFWRWCRRNPVIAGMAAALVLVFLAGFAGVAWKWQEAERQKGLAQAAERNEAEQHAIAIEQADLATREADRSRRLLYASDMSKAYQAWEAGDTGRTRDLLRSQRPQTGKEDLRGFEWRHLLQQCRDGSRQTLRGHTGIVVAVAFFRDGKTLVTADEPSGVCIWDFDSRRHAKLMLPAADVAIAPEGKLLAISRRDEQAIQLWDVAAGRPRGALPHPTWVRSMALSPKGELLATGDNDGFVRLWDLATRQELVRLEGHIGPVLSVRFSPDGKTLASGGGDFTVRLWDVAGKRPIATLRGHTFIVPSLSFSPDGKTLASASWDSSVRLWDTASGRTLKTLGDPKMAPGPVAFSPDGKSLANGGGDGAVRVWDVETKEVVALLRGHTAPVTAVEFAPDGRSLVSGSRDGTVKVWDMPAGKDPNILTRQKGVVTGIAFAPDGKTLAVSGGSGETLSLWDLASRRRDILQGQEQAVLAVAFARRAQALATTSFDGTVRLWDITRKREAAKFGFDGHFGYPAFSPDGKLLAVVGPWCSNRVWDTATQRPVAQLESAGRAQFSPDGALLAAPSGHTILLWDVATWRKLDSLTEPTADMAHLDFAPDGRTLATSDTDGTLRLWDLARKKQLASRRGHATRILSVAFSPDGRRLATASTDSTIKLWDVDLCHEVATLTGHTGPVTCVAFSPDGDTLASSSGDGTVRLWQAPPDLAAIREPADSPSVTTSETIRLPAVEAQGAARATLKIDGSAYRVDVAAVDKIDWYVQLVQLFDDLEDGATYTIRFRAKADVPRQCWIGAQRNGTPDWENIGLKEDFALTEKWQKYKFPFHPKKPGAVNRITFVLGQQTGTVWIDEFTVTKEAK